MKLRLLATAFVLVVGLTLPATAQFTQDPNDQGVADTVDMVLTVAPDATTNQLKVQFDLYGFNDVDTLSGMASGYGWDNPNLQMDSAVVAPIISSSFDFIISVYEGQNIGLTNTNQRFPFVASRLFNVGLLPDPSRRLWASYYFTLSSWSVTDSIVLDTLTYNSGVTWVFNNPLGEAYQAYWTGKDVVKDSAFVQPSNLVLSEDTLFFSAEAGDAFPPSQTFDITSDANPIDFDLLEGAPWLIKSPSFGTTPRTITVSINSTGLASGIYFDSIQVEAPDAANNPQFLYVEFELTEPAPEISVSPSELFFNAIAGGSNPSSQMLTLTNVGGGELDWTATNNELWLDVTPSSGLGGAMLTVSVDITGLSFNDYFDTIVVSDPNALNDPVRVPVRLTVASDLPVIQIVEQDNTIVVDLPEATPAPRTFDVLNAGGGLMNFAVTTSSPRITLTPDSGAAPATVEASFTIPGGTAGQVIVDTVWVSSNEAINSPQPVIFRFRFVEIPAVIVATPQVLTFNIYECSTPSGFSKQPQTFFVENGGGDNPLSVTLDFESEYVSVNQTTGVAPAQFEVTPIKYDLPQGNYFDTILVKAPNAINNPDTVYINYNIIPGDDPPVISLSRPTLTLILKEEAGPQLPTPIRVENGVPGCLEWSLSEDVPWVFPQLSADIAPSFVPLLIDPTGLTFGQYTDTILFSGTGASNSPLPFPVTLKIWKYNGDFNWDGKLNLTDITMLVNYLFLAGPPPQPALIVGDVTCDGLVNLSDVTYMVDFLFNGGPFPCGNPFKK